MDIVESLAESGVIDECTAHVIALSQDFPLEMILRDLRPIIERQLKKHFNMEKKDAGETVIAIEDRIRYEFFRPWDHYPVVFWGIRLALALSGNEDDDIKEQAFDNFLDPIRDDLIRKGCPADIARAWTDEIAAEASDREGAIVDAGGQQCGRA